MPEFQINLKVEHLISWTVKAKDMEEALKVGKDTQPGRFLRPYKDPTFGIDDSSIEVTGVWK